MIRQDSEPSRGKTPHRFHGLVDRFNKPLPYGSEHLGIQVEMDTLTPLAALTTFAIIAMLEVRSDIHGALNRKTGAAIVGFNHQDSIVDTFTIPLLARREKRSVRMVAKHTLVDPHAQEDPEVLSRTGKMGDWLNRKPGEPPSRFALRQAEFYRAVGVIPIHRGKPDSEAIRNIEGALAKGQLVGMSLQETRRPANDLLDMKPGVAMLARRNPDVPVYVVSINGRLKTLFSKRAQVHVSEPFTWNTLPEEHRTFKKATVYMAGELARTLPDALKTKWMEAQQAK